MGERLMRDDSIGPVEDAAQAPVSKAGQLVTFRLGKEIYGIDILKIQEVVNDIGVTHLPNAPDFIEGVINLRGKIIPVVDLNRRLSLAGSGERRHGRIIVLDLHRPLGIHVDDISTVLRLPPERFEHIPENAASESGAGCFCWLARTDDDQLVIVLNPVRLLSGGEMAAITTFVQKKKEEEAQGA